MGTEPYDVAVVGAGMAGLTAARLLAEAGKSVVLVEAQARVGGRVLSARSAHGSVLELGAEFVHGKPKPTLDLAREAGITLTPLSDLHYRKHGAQLVTVPDAFAPMADVLSRLKPSERDVSAQAFLTEQGIGAEAAERFRQLVEGFEAAPIDEVSIQSLAADSEAASKDDSQFRVQGGYGQLVGHQRERALASGVELLLSSAVSGVKWRPAGPISLIFEADRPALGARACVLAVPLGVLQSRELGLCFEPPAAAWQVPLEQLAMGHACRVVMEFSGGPLDSRVPAGAFIHQPTSLFETFWSQENNGHQIWTAWAGGPKARELARESVAQRKRLALGALAALFELTEAALEQRLSSVEHHDFSNDERARGAYSFCRPGGSKASEALSQPLGSAVFLAGEATDHQFPGTVAGAIASGQRAAKQLLTALGSR